MIMPHFKIRQRESDFQNNRTAYPTSETNKLDNSYDDEFDRFLNSERDQEETMNESYDFAQDIVKAVAMLLEAKKHILFFKDSFEESEENIHETMDLILIDHINKLSEKRKEAIKEARGILLSDEFMVDEFEDSSLNSNPLGEERPVFPWASEIDDHDRLTGFH